MRRRSFLQQIGWSLAALGLDQTGLVRWGTRYQQALAQSTPRKLALLVGINQYLRGPTLNGCLTDVELQRELLIHRFGFQNSDILILTEQQATREQIEAAFVAHLIEQVRPGDTVVFHFSGYGSLMGQGLTPDARQRTLVPIDGGTVGNPGAINDLPEETLLLLLRSLQTDRISTILDTGYVLPPSPDSILLGNLRVRARPALDATVLQDSELAFQEDLLSRIKGSRSQASVERRSGQFPGVVLAAAGTSLDPALLSTWDGKAFETRWSGFSSGLLTYALTQFLWEATASSTLQVSFSRAVSQVEHLAGKEQQPSLIGQKSRDQTLLAYYLTPTPAAGAEGVITSVEDEGRSCRFWLAGLPSAVLEHYGNNSILVTVPTATSTSESEPAPDTSSSSATFLQITTRNGLAAKGRVVPLENSGDRVQVGQAVQEWVRVLPRQVSLIVALDANLERIERVDATSAFSGLQMRSVVAGEQAADCVIGRVNTGGTNSPTSSPPKPTDASISATPEKSGTANSADLPATLPSNQYGLFSVGHSLVPNTVGPKGEAVKLAVQRLVPALRTLLAAKILRLTVNEGSSRLGVRAVLEMVSPDHQILMQRSTLRVAPNRTEAPAKSSSSAKAIPETGVVNLPIGSRIRYQLHNESNRPLYFILLGLDNNGSPIALYSNQPTPTSGEADASIKSDLIAPGETTTVPQVSNAFEWVIREPVGIAETYILFSVAPFTQTLAALAIGLKSTGNNQRIGVPHNPVDVAQAVLQDLHQASSTTPFLPALSGDTIALQVECWATLSFIYQVV